MDDRHNRSSSVPLPRPISIEEIDKIKTNQQQFFSQSLDGRVRDVTLDFHANLSSALLRSVSELSTSTDDLAFACYHTFLYKVSNAEKFFSISRYNNGSPVQSTKFPILLEINSEMSIKAHLQRLCDIFQGETLLTNMTTRSNDDFGLEQPLHIYKDISYDFHVTGDQQTFSKPNLKNFDLCLTVIHDTQTNQLTTTFTGSDDLFDQVTLDHLSLRFHLLCKQLFLDNTFDLERQPIYSVSILLPHERALLQALDCPQTSTSNITCIHHAFVQQALRYPDRLAVILDQQSWTYEQLFNRVQRLAFILVNEQHVQPGDIVCQCIDRSLDMIIGILAIMMSGGVYAPLSTYDTVDRLNTLAHQVDAKLILVSRSSLFHDRTSDIPIVDISGWVNNDHPLNAEQKEELSNVLVTPDSISHIVFTSGSTGIPKAVQIRHRNFVCYANGHSIEDDDVILQLANSSFDVHLDEILSTLIRGARLVLLKPGGHLDFDYLTRVIENSDVTFVAPVPSWIDALVKFLNENSHARNRVRKVRWWFIGGNGERSWILLYRVCIFTGEQLLSGTISRFLPYVDADCHILNTYGPAEITETATYHEIDRKELSNSIVVPIGRPMQGYSIHLLDEHRQKVIPGEQGEIVVGGVGVFAGYYGRSDLTDQVMFDVDGQQCYATGDFARLNVNSGELIFVGRRDHQIKLRGQRIELGHIESVILRSSSDIANCVVLKEGSSEDSYLVAVMKLAHIVENNHSEDALVQFCRSELPSFMIPSRWHFVADFPITKNGKIDRSQLRYSSHKDGSDIQKRMIGPASVLEKKLADIFMRAFNLNITPDVNSTFAQLGGTSLGAMHALSIIRKELLESMDIGLLMANPSIRQLAKALKSQLDELQCGKHILERDDDFSTRPSSSWIIETIGIVFILCLWLWPVYISNGIYLPILHLLQYVIVLRLLGGPVSTGRDTLYSWQYYRVWFFRRLWSLNTFWLQHLLGTPLYNAYLRLCGACIGNGVHIYTTRIDLPWLLTVGDDSYIGQEVVLSSLTYYDCVYECHQISIGSYCSIGARSVLHDRVDMCDRVSVEPLTSVTGRIYGNGNSRETEITCSFNQSQSIFQCIFVLLVFMIHSLILQYSCYFLCWLPTFLTLPLCWLVWSMCGSVFGLIFLRFLTSNVKNNGNYPLNSWSFLRVFWLRSLIVHSFGPCLATVFDRLTSVSPLILRWLGVDIEISDVEIADFVSMLIVPSNLLIIEQQTTMTSEICFVPYEVDIHGQSIIVGPIRIGRCSFLGNNCIIRSGVHIPPGTLIGSLTRIDSTTVFNEQDRTYVGVPARPMPFSSSNKIEQTRNNLSKLSIVQRIIDNALPIIVDVHHLLLLAVLISLSFTMATNVLQFFIAISFSLLIYSFLISNMYQSLMIGNFEENMNWRSTLAMTLFDTYSRYVGQILGGTQWLTTILRQFGAQIGNDVIIDDINSLYDVHLISIGNHTRLSLTSQIQCHTFEQRQLIFHPVIIKQNCIIKSMSLILRGVVCSGTNYLAPCSLVLPHERLPEYTDWRGSPIQRIIIQHSLEPPEIIFAKRRSQVDTYDVIVGRYSNDILILYFGENGWMGWQSAINLRRPFQPCDTYIRLFFTSFLCKSKAQSVLIIGLGGGLWPTLIQHYFPTVKIDVVEIDRTVIELTNDYFGNFKQSMRNHLKIYADDGFHYVETTSHRYDLIFIDAFLGEVIPTHMNSHTFFDHLRYILNENGCVATNANVPNGSTFDKISNVLCDSFESNILLAHTNTIENARVIISGDQSSLLSIASYNRTIQLAEHFQSDIGLEFNLAHILALAYKGPIHR